ncbi:hypothetical protein [Halorubrum sp. DTA46]|uniref:hypothetical protein n=1 Tax=Halorubrum sp. DTA46 TaxID=3402162 RepID=UPI003AAC0EE3
MLTYLSIGGAFLLLCVIGGTGFYVGARHVAELSGIVRNPDRPNWAQEPVDAFNRVVGRPTSRDPAAALYEAEETADEGGDTADEADDTVNGTAAPLDSGETPAASADSEEADR